jgi:hypothetical protein
MRHEMVGFHGESCRIGGAVVLNASWSKRKWTPFERRATIGYSCVLAEACQEQSEGRW